MVFLLSPHFAFLHYSYFSSSHKITIAITFVNIAVRQASRQRILPPSHPTKGFCCLSSSTMARSSKRFSYRLKTHSGGSSISTTGSFLPSDSVDDDPSSLPSTAPTGPHGAAPLPPCLNNQRYCPLANSSLFPCSLHPWISLHARVTFVPSPSFLL